MKASDRDVHVIVVAYGAPDQLATCLDALQGAYPVTVIDNSSSEAVEAVAGARGARYVDPAENLGFAKGVNRGLASLSRPLGAVDVLLLNPDAVIHPDGVRALVAALHDRPRIAAAAPTQLAPGAEVPDRVAWPFPTPGGAWVEALGLGRFRRSPGFLVGSILALRGEAIDDVGDFDERFYLYAEETDWQRRATERGWEVRFCEDVVATHLGAGTDNLPERRELRFHAALERYVRKWHGAFGWQVFRGGVILGAGVRAVALRSERARDAARRAQLYWSGPDRIAQKRGAVPAPDPNLTTT